MLCGWKRALCTWGHEMAYTEGAASAGYGVRLQDKEIHTPLLAVMPIWPAKQKTKAHSFAQSNCGILNRFCTTTSQVLRDGKIAGYVTSGAWGQSLGAAVGLCLLELPEGEKDKASVEIGRFSVLVEGKNIMADVRDSPPSTIHAASAC